MPIRAMKKNISDKLNQQISHKIRSCFILCFAVFKFVFFFRLSSKCVRGKELLNMEIIIQMRRICI